MQRHELIRKIEQLPPDRLAEVENFVDSLERRNLVRTDVHQALADFAAQYGGTEADLDHALEEAAAEHLVNQTSR